HRALLDAGGNRLLGSLGRAVEIALEHSFLVSTRTPGAVEASLPAHRAVVQAVEAHDPAAAAVAVLAIVEAAEDEIARSPGMPDGAA
ncbi:FCD domain-containing protein, partial [Streptomyces violaceoruber]